jgi:outer membrane protein TolC
MTPANLIVALLLAQAGGPPVLTLDMALKEAEKGSRDLKVAQARLAQAHLLHKKAWANYLPTFTAGGSYTRNSDAVDLSIPDQLWLRDMSGVPGFDPTKVNGPAASAQSLIPGAPSNTILVPVHAAEFHLQKKDQLGAQIALSQPLVVPALWPAIESSYLAEQVAELSVENARREVLFAAAQIYYGAASLKENVSVYERLLQQARAHEKDAEAQTKAGAVPKIVLLRAQIDRARAEQDLVRAHNAYESAKIALATLMARDQHFEVENPPEPALPAQRDDREEAALKDRPDLRAARGAAVLAEKQETTSKYKYAPNVGLQAAYRVANVQGFVDSYTSWSVTLGLNWTIWDGGVREIEVDENAAKVAEAQAQLEGLELKAREEVRRAVLDLESARANLTKADEQLKLARENQQMIDNNFKAGVATALEASDADTAQRNAEIGFVAERLNSQLAALRLAKAVGAFDPK